MNISGIEAFASAVSCLLLCILWFGFLKPQRQDAFREELFTLRGRLFVLAADKNISFHDPAYKQLRMFINGLLRFTHRISPLALAVSSAFAAPPQNPYAEWQGSLEKISPQAKKALLDIHEEVFTIFVKYLFAGSIIMWIVFSVFWLGFALKAIAVSAYNSRTPRHVSQVVNSKFSRAIKKRQILERETYCVSDTHDFATA